MSIIHVPDTNKIIIIDYLTSAEDARRNIKLYQEHHTTRLEQEAETCAVYYTHCYVDHFGGAQAIVDKTQNNLRIISPDGFLKRVVNENIYARGSYASPVYLPNIEKPCQSIPVVRLAAALG